MSKQEGITIKKSENFSEWYTQLIQKVDLADYSAVSGCIVFKPLSWNIWENIMQEVNSRIKKMNVKNVYFPLLIPESLLKKATEHIEGFTAEVAWVTETGNSKLNEKLAIRPTSEAIMYDSFSKWIRSWRDLPLKYNQWSNIIRWEFQHPIPFFRTREFVFNEGHTVFATKEEAEAEMKPIIGMYNEILKDYMALYGLIGKKTDKEKFAGAEYTISIEFLLPNGKSAQGPDFHHDGQKFAKAYNIKFLDRNEKEQFVWQNTWALSTRMLGVMFATHSDDKGLILPPKLAENKIVIIPILFKKDKEKIIKKAKEIEKKLKKYSPILDLREDYSPGWKYNEYEMKGIPIRIELGPNDLKKKQFVLIRRDNNKKEFIKETQLIKKIESTLEDIQKSLYEKSKQFTLKNMVKVNTFDDLKKAIDNKKIALTTLCEDTKCEDLIKEKTNGAKVLNIPFDQPKKLGNCIICKKQAKYEVRIGKSY